MGTPRCPPLRLQVLIGLALLLAGGLPIAQQSAAEPKGQMILAVDFSIAPSWFDPGEAPPLGTPFIFLYALHDALIKPLPGNVMAPALAESWTESGDGLTYDFKLREGLTFHNGDPFTGEDVKFSFERYKGASAGPLREKVKSVEVVSPSHVRFHLKEPWPDFLVFYGTPASAAAWILPKKYLERVGDEAFKKLPVGLGPYKFVEFRPGVELVVEAYAQYWRKMPQVQRLIFKIVPERPTRLAMVKTGEADIGFVMGGPELIAAHQDSRLRLGKTFSAVVVFLVFPDQWDPKSPWHDRRVRLAAAQAIDVQAINEAERLGWSRLTGSIVPREFDFALPVEAYPYNPELTKRLLAEAGYPNGFDAGDANASGVLLTYGEPVVNYLGAVGIKTRVRAMERAAFFSAWHEKKLKGVIIGATGAHGNAATRIAEVVVSGGYYADGGYPDIDALFQQQAKERDREKRGALLHEIQRRIAERVMVAPLMQPAVVHAVGPRVAEPAIGITPLAFYPVPYEEMRLKE
ncbi:MAG: ABC transporter substrate-binding protein [Candidatus Entotheonellia bacterium]